MTTTKTIRTTIAKITTAATIIIVVVITVAIIIIIIPFATTVMTTGMNVIHKSKANVQRSLGPVSWKPTTFKWRQFLQSNRHSTIGTRQTEYHEALPSSANVQSHLTSLFTDDGDASWYSVCRVPMVEWRLDCEDCRHLTVVGLHDTGPRTLFAVMSRMTGLEIGPCQLCSFSCLLPCSFQLILLQCRQKKTGIRLRVEIWCIFVYLRPQVTNSEKRISSWRTNLAGYEEDSPYRRWS